MKMHCSGIISPRSIVLLLCLNAFAEILCTGTESTGKQSNGLKVLVVAPHNSSTKSHFNMSSREAILLGQQEFVDSVLLLVPVWAHEKEEGHWPNAKKLAGIESVKVKVQLYTVEYEDVQKLGNYGIDTRAGAQADEKDKKPETGNNKSKVKNKGLLERIKSLFSSSKKEVVKKWPVVNPQMSRYIIYENEHLIFEVMAKDQALIEELKVQNFDAGMAEHFHMGAFALFPLLGIRHSAVSRVSTVNAGWFDFASLREKAIEFKVPERKAVMTDRDAAIAEERDYAKDYTNALTVYNGDLAKAENEFRQIYAEYGVPFKPFQELFAQTDYKFVNWQLGMDFPQVEQLVTQTTKNWVYIGGICMPKYLGKADTQTKEWFAAKYDHVVPVSFGSILETEEMPVEYFQTFMSAFDKFPNVLFVWNFKFGPKGKDVKLDVKVPSNVRLVDWMQLPLILKKAKTQLFVAHCGGGSAGESIAAGIPVICIPFSAGQPYNARAMRARNLAQVVDIDQIGNQRLETAIKEGLTWKEGNKQFQDQLHIVQQQMRKAEQNFADAMRNVHQAVMEEKEETVNEENSKNVLE